MPTLAVPLTLSPGATADITGGSGIGLNDVAGVTTIPSFTAIAGTGTLTITPKLNGCFGTPQTVVITVNNCCVSDFFSFNTSATLTRFEFELSSGFSLSDGDVDWGDSTTSTLINGSNIHTYASAGTRNVSITNAQVGGNDCNDTVKNINVISEINSINLSGLPSLETFSHEAGILTSIDFTNNPNLSVIQIVSCQLSGVINITGTPRNLQVILADNNLSTADVDAILLNYLNMTSLGNNTRGIDLTFNSPPSAAGLITKASIIAKNYFCNTD